MNNNFKDVLLQTMQVEIRKRAEAGETLWLADFILMPDANRYPLIAGLLIQTREELVAQRSALALQKLNKEKDIDSAVAGIDKLFSDLGVQKEVQAPNPAEVMVMRGSPNGVQAGRDVHTSSTPKRRLRKSAVQ